MVFNRSGHSVFVDYLEIEVALSTICEGGVTRRVRKRWMAISGNSGHGGYWNLVLRMDVVWCAEVVSI
jgi:hypothetical protein